MPSFAYSVRDASGVLRNGTSEAENPDALARRLREQGFQIAEIKQSKPPRRPASGTSFWINFKRSS